MYFVHLIHWGIKLREKSDGREFETKVYHYILKTLESNSYVGAENIFLHKKYFSKDRDDYIETDITIEIKIQNILFLIIVVECKDYKNSLDISYRGKHVGK